MRYIKFLVIVLFTAACVPNKKVVLFQKDDLYQEDAPKSTVLRNYDIPAAEYELSEGDIIRIQINSLTDDQFNFFKEDEVRQGGGSNIQLAGQIIDKLGSITYPVIGRIKISGLTLLEAEDYIQEVAAKYVTDPVVKIRLLNYRVTLLGEINGPGTYNTFNNKMSFPEALGYAGGFTELADINNIKLIRQIEGKQVVVYINPLEEDFLTSEYYYLYPNDLIIVSPLKQRAFRQYFGENLSLLVSSLSLLFLVYNLAQ